MANGILIFAFCCFCVLQVEAVDQEHFFPFGPDNGDDYLPPINNIASPAINLTWGIPFYNHKYWKIFVNDNGLLSFENEYTKYDTAQPVFPFGPELQETTDREMILIAPFWANVDISPDRGDVYYRQTEEQDLLDRASAAVHTGFVEWDDFQAKLLIIATWIEVGFYGAIADGVNLANSFQCIIASDEFETFAIFIYDRIEWTTGVESHGVPELGIGGSPAQVGFNAGDGFKSSSHRYSRDSNFLTFLPDESDINVPGMWVYDVSSVSVDRAGCTTAGEVKTFPRYDSMLGHQLLYIGGPCFTPDDEIWIQFGPFDDPLALTYCTRISSQRAWCVVPTFYQVGRIETRVSINNGTTFPYRGTFDIVAVGSDGPPDIKRIDPHSESWMLADRPVAIEWDPGLMNFTHISIDILTYSEADGVVSWEETENIDSNAENTGRYEWTPRANSKITTENAVGVIRITQRHLRDQVAIWSDVHWLGYMMNDDFQSDPAVYSNQQCELWNKRMVDEPTWDSDKDLNPCPLDMSQAIADRVQFRPLDTCDMSMASEDDDEDYCFFREGIKHCVISIINSPQNADSICCYDFEENLVSAADSIYGSFSHRHTIHGVPPYNAPKAVPVMSTWIHDIIPYYSCCVMGDLCEYYQVHRPTRASRWCDTPRMAVAFGDPHFVTFDGVEYTFNGKGEWTFMRTVTGAKNRFTIQGRTEQMLDWKGELVNATRVTSVAMNEDDRSNIEIQLSSRTVLQVVYHGQYLKIDRQTRIPMDGFYLNFPREYEDGNITQVIITFLNSGIGVVVNGTAEGMFIQVVIPNGFKGYVEGLMGNWDEVPDNDLTSNGGTPVSPNATSEEIYNQFGKSWEIDPTDSLFLYDQGKNHDYYQDDDFVPNFGPPDGNLPPYLDTQNITDTCDGNKFCIYDTQSTGILQLGKATKKAYDDYKQAYRALQDKKLSITPNRGGMMGGEPIYLHGPCAEVGVVYTCVFTYDGAIIQEVTATISDNNETFCVPDPFFLVGEVSMSVNQEGDDLEGSPTAYYSIIESGRIPPTVARSDSDSSIWDRSGHPLTITWTEDEESFGSSQSALTISVLAYREDDPIGPRWVYVYPITYGTADNGSYTFTPNAQLVVTERNAFGIIRISGNAAGRQRVLWSDIHPLGYLLEQEYQDDPAQWASEKCDDWITGDDARPSFVEDLPACPCTLDQAEQDLVTFITDPTCYPDSPDPKTCSKNEGAIHCFLSAYASPSTMSGTKCCYDSNSLLIHSRDTKNAGMSGRSHVRGASPYRQQDLVPELSHWSNDIIAKQICCEWADEEKCFAYMTRRPTTDCVDYEPPQTALSFGDPHYVTMDGFNLTFNGLGEYTILRYATSSSKTGASNFELQGRQTRSKDDQGNLIDVTQLSAVAMKDIGSDYVFVEASAYNGMNVFRRRVEETNWNHVDFSQQTVFDMQGCSMSVTHLEHDVDIYGVVVMFQETGIGVHITYDYGMLAVRPVLPPTLDSNHLSGLLGNMDGDASNDLVRRDSNTPLNEDASDQEIFVFGESWEIETEYSNFKYDINTVHSDYHNASFIPRINVELPILYPPCNDVQQCLFDYEVSNNDVDLAMATRDAYEAFESSSENLNKIDACPYLITPWNGTKTYSSNTNKYFEGAEVLFNCNEGLIMVGSRFKTCRYVTQEGNTEGTLAWTGTEGYNECFESSCGPLDTPVNGSISLNEDQTVATFSCEEGYHLIGSPESHCLDEEWSGSTPSCSSTHDPGPNVVAIAIGITCGAIAIVIIVVLGWLNYKKKNKSLPITSQKTSCSESSVKYDNKPSSESPELVKETM